MEAPLEICILVVVKNLATLFKTKIAFIWGIQNYSDNPFKLVSRKFLIYQLIS